MLWRRCSFVPFLQNEFIFFGTGEDIAA
ncbi:MAG: hypothetical protein ACD_10C00050G0001, partial [uncultured bacterium]